MKKLFWLLFAAGTLHAQTAYTTYVGTIRDLTGAVVTSGRITWRLNAPLGQLPGTGSFVATVVSCTITSSGAVKANDGTAPCSIVNNTALTPTGTSYTLCMQPKFISPGSCFATYATGGTVDISTIIPTPTTQPNYGSSGTGVPSGATGEVQINGGANSFAAIPGFVYSNGFLDGRTAGPSGAGLSIAAAALIGNIMGTGLNGGYMESLSYTPGSGLDPNPKHLMACILSDGTAHACPTASPYWTGLNNSTGGSPSVSSAFIAGSAPCVFDNTPALGDFVTLSTTTAGQCHDTGASSMPASGTLVGQVTGAATGSEAPVYLMRTTPSHGTTAFATGTLSNQTFSGAMFNPTKITGTGITLANITAVANAFTCGTSPTFTLQDCGTSAGSCASPVALGTVTITAINTVTDGTISNPSLSPGHYLVWAATAGTCSTLSASGTVTY